MSIYTLDYDREECLKRFSPCYLYIKRHKITGLKYFGKTIQDPLKYKGSGTLWLRHIRKHGTSHVETIWYKFFDNIDECRNYALKFSNDNNIVASEEWANLIVEDGLGANQKTRNKISEAGKSRAAISDETRLKMSNSHLGKSLSEEHRSNISIAVSAPRPSRVGKPSALRGRTYEFKPRKKASEETKAKMRASQHRRRHPESQDLLEVNE